jgi:hypothetical protein
MIGQFSCLPTVVEHPTHHRTLCSMPHPRAACCQYRKGLKTRPHISGTKRQ